MIGSLIYLLAPYPPANSAGRYATFRLRLTTACHGTAYGVLLAAVQPATVVLPDNRLSICPAKHVSLIKSSAGTRPVNKRISGDPNAASRSHRLEQSDYTRS